MWLRVFLVNSWQLSCVMSARTHLALRPASFMPTRPMVEKWLSKVPR